MPRSCPKCFTPYSKDVDHCGLDGTRLRDFQTDPLIGQAFDRYQISGHLGDGGMARVYRATHGVLKREYAIKVLLGEVASNKTLAERFRREAEAVSQIAHENVVSVVDFGTTAEGLTFLIMELVEGRTLRQVMNENRRLAPARTAHIMRQICAGLQEAHSAGFIHRDLKPSNIMLFDDDHAKILDFGLVRAREAEEDDHHLTRAGQFVGTPIYMSPEQILGTDIDGKADFYALGVMMFEMLEGNPPYLAKKLSQLRKKHLEAPVPDMRPAGGLEDVVRKLMEKKPTDRPANASEVIAMIDRMSGSLGATVVDISVADDEPPTELIDSAKEASFAVSAVASNPGELPRPRRHTWLLWASGLAFLALPFIWMVTRPPEPQPDLTPVAAPPPPPPKPAPEPPAIQVAEPAPPATEAVEEPPPPPVKRVSRRTRRKQIQRLESALNKRLRSRGLTWSEVRRPSAWLRAKKKLDVSRAASAQRDLLKKIDAFEIDRALVDRRLDQLSKRLAAASKTVPLAKLRPLEDRYLELAARQTRTQRDHETLLKDASALARAIQRASR